MTLITNTLWCFPSKSPEFRTPSFAGTVSAYTFRNGPRYFTVFYELLNMIQGSFLSFSIFQGISTVTFKRSLWNPQHRNSCAYFPVSFKNHIPEALYVPSWVAERAKVPCFASFSPVANLCPRWVTGQHVPLEPAWIMIPEGLLTRHMNLDKLTL